MGSAVAGSIPPSWPSAGGQPASPGPATIAACLVDYPSRPTQTSTGSTFGHTDLGQRQPAKRAGGATGSALRPTQRVIVAGCGRRPLCLRRRAAVMTPSPLVWLDVDSPRHGEVVPRSDSVRMLIAYRTGGVFPRPLVGTSTPPAGRLVTRSLAGNSVPVPIEPRTVAGIALVQRCRPRSTGCIAVRVVHAAGCCGAGGWGW